MRLKPSVSVVIPCFNQAVQLKETLEALSDQSLPAKDFEVIVVDDGSTDSTQDVIGSIVVPYKYQLLRQRNRGAAVARNLGANQAQADILLFLDADMIADSKLIAIHLEMHKTYDRALVAGRRKPWPAVRTSVFSRVIDIDSNIPSNLDVHTAIDFGKAHSCNMSLRYSDWLELRGFDERFPASGFEDVDMVYRAIRKGLRIVFSPEAFAYHNHPMTFKQYCEQSRSYQRSAVLLLKNHPELRGHFDHLKDKEPIAWGHDQLGLVILKIARRLLAMRPVLHAIEQFANHLERRIPSTRLLPSVYWKIIGSYQLLGLRDGIQQHGW